jgi:hypothetical protein
MEMMDGVLRKISAEANEDEEIGPQTTACFGRDFITKHRSRIRRITGSGGGTPWSRPSLNTVIVSG